MRFRAFVVFACLVLAGYAAADIIHLKDGGTIVCEHVREGGGGIQYDKNGSTFTIPKSWVESVETNPSDDSKPESSATQEQSGAGSAGASQPETSRASASAKAEAPRHLDDEDLAKIEKRGNRAQTATAYLAAGKDELESGEIDRAVEHFEHAARLYPDNPAVLSWYASALSRAGKHADAIENAEKVTKLAPESPNAYTLLGTVLYRAEKPGAAARAFKRSLELQPDAQVQAWLDKAEREARVEGFSSQRESPHFSIKYEGGQTSGLLATDVLQELESERRDLHEQLGAWPRDNIVVILYTQKEFAEITQSPDWAVGVNDGRLHIPIQGLTSVTAALSRVLKHELTHTFLIDMTGNRCPGWLQEGIAQLMEGRDAAGAAVFLSRTNRAVPLRSLESSFLHLSGSQAGVAYAEALVTTDYIRRNYGMSGLLRIVQRIGEGESPEEALRESIQLDYAKLQEKVTGSSGQKVGATQ